MLAILVKEHKSILAVASRIGTMLTAATRPDQFPLGATRWEFVRMLMQHLTFKDACVYRILLDKEPAQTINSINHLLEECRALYAAYRQHTVQWDPDALVREWPRYKIETLILISRLNRLVADERRILYPLASHWTLSGKPVAA
jgi:hypothetical protein